MNHSFRAEANEQYVHRLCDQYYAAIAHSALWTSDPMKVSPSSMVAWALTFSSHSKSGKMSTQTTSIEASSLAISEKSQEPKLSKKTPKQCQNKK